MGIGSTFYFKLKLERTTQKVPTMEQDFTKLINKEVLLVEDTAINAMLMKNYCKMGDFSRSCGKRKLAVEAVNLKNMTSF